MDIRRAIETVLGEPLIDISPLSGGCVGQVYTVRTADQKQLVAKVDDSSQPRLDVEGYMLRFLAANSALPVPQVWYSTPSVLIMSWVAGRSSFDAATQEDAALLLANLHDHTAATFGLERDTLIGGLAQPNTLSDDWIPFFRDQRLRYMASEAAQVGRLPREWLARIDRLGDRLPQWLREPSRPSLIHGDVWTNNVLARSGQISGFLDPAIYYADPEIELAFIALFGTFGEPFFARYQALRPLAPGFFEERRDLYNLYPLLVHCRLFGGSYISQVDTILRRYGF